MTTTSPTPTLSAVGRADTDTDKWPLQELDQTSGKLWKGLLSLFLFLIVWYPTFAVFNWFFMFFATIFFEGEVTICPKPAPKLYLLSMFRSDAGGTVGTFCAVHNCTGYSLKWTVSSTLWVFPLALCKRTFELLFYLILWPLNNLISTQDRTVLSGLKFTRKCTSPPNLWWGTGRGPGP